MLCVDAMGVQWANRQRYFKDTQSRMHARTHHTKHHTSQVKPLWVAAGHAPAWWLVAGGAGGHCYLTELACVKTSAITAESSTCKLSNRHDSSAQLETACYRCLPRLSHCIPVAAPSMRCFCSSLSRPHTTDGLPIGGRRREHPSISRRMHFNVNCTTMHVSRCA
jgi:hypothetical protein